MLNVGASFMHAQLEATFFYGELHAFVERDQHDGRVLDCPPNGDDLAAEWGTTAPRHRAGGMVQHAADPEPRRQR